MKLFDRYILSEAFENFFLSLFSLSALFVIVKAFHVLRFTVYGISFLDIIILILLGVLSMVPYLIPPAWLVALSGVFSRISSDREIIALKSSGISPFRIVVAPVIFSFFLTIICIFLHMLAAPEVNKAFKGVILRSVLSQRLQRFVPDKFEEVVPKVAVYKDKKGYILFNSVGDGNFTVIRSNSLDIAKSVNGVLVRFAKAKAFYASHDMFNVISFKKGWLFIPVKYRLAVKLVKSKKEMSFKEVMEIAKRKVSYAIYIHKRIAFSFSCIIFCIFAFAFFLKEGERSRRFSFLFSSALFVAYYVLSTASYNLAYKGVSPFIACWLSNIIFLTVSIFLMVKNTR